MYLVSETGKEKMRETAKQTEKSTDESSSPETQLLTIKDGGIKRDGEKMRSQG